MKKYLYALLVCTLLLPSLASAHQPRLNQSTVTEVVAPEISKAYYGTLSGQPHIYKIFSPTPFHLYVNVLVPDIAGQKKDVSALIIKNGNTAEPLATLDGTAFAWKQFFEPFGHDSYYMGPEYEGDVEAGSYEVRVYSSALNSKYSLAIGQIEAFDLTETINAITLIPILKKNFFNTSPADFILSPFGAGYIVVMYVLAALFGFALRALLTRLPQESRTKRKNIGRNDRSLRFVLALILLIWAVTTTWNPWLLLFSGLTFFEGVASWCALYSVLGKNTCVV